MPDISKKIRIEKETVIQSIAYKNKFAIDIFNSTLRKRNNKKNGEEGKGEEEINKKSYSKFTYIGKRRAYFMEIWGTQI